MGKLRLSFVTSIILILTGVSLYAQDAQVDTRELESNLAPVSFINYEGPHVRIETRDQIWGVGYSLGTAVQAGAVNTGGTGRYFVIHSVSGPEDGKLDADIMGFGVDVGVDHIRNLRLIVQGYLEGAYTYSAQDAALLAEYITIYNAVFRGDWNFFTGRYKTPVVQHLTPEKAGLSIRFDEWPGQTLMVIPLALAQPGSLSAVDTSTLTDPRVTEELRGDEDRGIPQRQGMVDLMERESEEAGQRAEQQRRETAREEQQIAQDRQQAQQEREQIAQDRQQVEQAEAEGKISPEEAEQAKEELTEREDTADRKEEEIAQREDALEEKQEEARRTEEFADQKAEEAREQREEIARDQQEIIAQESGGPVTVPQGVLGARLERPDSSLGRLVLLSPDSGTELKISALNTLNIRTLAFIDGKVLAVAGENRGNGAIRLIDIDPGSLEMLAQGDDDIHPQSLLWVNGSDLYAVTVSDGNLYLGRYNTALARQARSTVTVHPFATVTFQGDLVLTQNAGGKGIILNARDLSERKE
jgi:hypothetical protein